VEFIVIPCAAHHASGALQTRDRFGIHQPIPDQRSNISHCIASGMTVFVSQKYLQKSPKNPTPLTGNAMAKIPPQEGILP
jgi:hypothetical protein